jgi:hypothetical protein
VNCAALTRMIDSARGGRIFCSMIAACSVAELRQERAWSEFARTLGMSYTALRWASRQVTRTTFSGPGFLAESLPLFTDARHTARRPHTATVLRPGQNIVCDARLSTLARYRALSKDSARLVARLHVAVNKSSSEFIAAVRRSHASEVCSGYVGLTFVR